MEYPKLNRQMISNPKGMRVAAVTPPHGQDGNLDFPCSLTSRLYLLCTASDQVLYLLRGDLCPLPGISPLGLRRSGIGRCDGFGLLLGRGRVLAPKDTRKERHGWEDSRDLELAGRVCW